MSRFKYRGDDTHYVLVEESSDIKVASKEFSDLDYSEFVKIKKEPHNYHFDEASGKIKRKGVKGTLRGSSFERNNQPDTDSNPSGYHGTTAIGSSIGTEKAREESRGDGTL